MFDTFIQLANVFLSIFRIPFIAAFIFIGYYIIAVLFWYLLRKIFSIPGEKTGVYWDKRNEKGVKRP